MNTTNVSIAVAVVLMAVLHRPMLRLLLTLSRALFRSEEHKVWQLERWGRLVDGPRVLAGISSEPWLARIAKGPNDDALRGAALSRLNDESVLEAIARDDQNPDLAQQALQRLSTDAHLNAVARATRHESVRETAIEKVTDEAVLAEIAVGAGPVALKAAERIRDDDVLTQLALAAQEQDVRRWGARTATRQRSLVRIAIESRDIDVALAATERLILQPDLSEVAREAPSGQVRLAAAKKLGKESALELVARSDPDPEVAAAAERSLADPDEETSAQIAAHLERIAPGSEHARRPARRVKDQALLAMLFRSAKSESFRKDCFARITEPTPEILEELARADQEWAREQLLTYLKKGKSKAISSPRELAAVFAGVDYGSALGPTFRRDVVKKLAASKDPEVASALLDYCKARCDLAAVDRVPYPLLPSTHAMVQALLELLEEPSDDLRRLAVQALLSVKLRSARQFTAKVQAVAAKLDSDEAKALLGRWERSDLGDSVCATLDDLKLSEWDY